MLKDDKYSGSGTKTIVLTDMDLTEVKETETVLMAEVSKISRITLK